MTDIGRRRGRRCRRLFSTAAQHRPGRRDRPAAQTRSLEDLQHIVVFMQENRSFDHYFGTLPGVRGFGDRFRPRCKLVAASAACGCSPMPAASARSRRSRWIPPRISATCAWKPHTWPDAQRAWDQGRMGQWPKAKQNHSMGYFQRSDLPFQCALADAFTICDAYHCSNAGRHQPEPGVPVDRPQRSAGPRWWPGDRQLARQFPEQGGHPASYRWTSYVERLGGVSWQIYQDMADNSPTTRWRVSRPSVRPTARRQGMTRSCALAGQHAGLTQLRQDVIDGRLPQVSFIIADAAGSEHPVQPGTGRGLYRTRAGCADRRSGRVEPHRPAADVRRERWLLRPHAAPAPPSPVDGGWAGVSSVSTEGEYHRHPAPGDESTISPNCAGARTVWDRACPCT